ncbi:hypothetical protein M9H77_11029 [Catharanthus roseus]|uniref:Uncharacterized protein n=1 Tax=Catharanthus roseus TaxID=4058 RepID=A0ACC0BDG4_CATRO|nr:hypothetical protein M9H77_11029 [Catharanthus roseus]
MVATLLLRPECPMNEGHWGQIHNTISEIREEKTTNQILERKKGRIARHMCNGMFVPKYLSRCSTHDVNEVIKSKYVADFLENEIKLRNASDRANVSRRMLLFAVFYMERFSPVGEKVSPYQSRRTPRIVDWSYALINKRVQKFRELRLFSRVDIDMVDALGPRKDAAELDALRSTFDSFGADVIEVKGELKSLWESVNQIGRNVSEEGEDIQMDSEKTKETRFEILITEMRGDLPESRPKNVQPFIDDGLNGHTAKKLVMPMSVPSWLAGDMDCPIVTEDVTMHDADEDTVSDRKIDEGDDIIGCNEICDERVVNDEEDTCSKEAQKLPSRVLSRKKMMIDLRRLPNMVKFKILQNLWDLKKYPGESVAEMVLHDCNRNILLTYAERRKYNGKARIWYLSTWFQICVPIHWDKDHWFMFIVDILKYKITMLDSLRSCVAGKKSVVNEVVYLLLQKFTPNHSKHDCGVFLMKFLENASNLKVIEKIKLETLYSMIWVITLSLVTDISRFPYI